MARVEETQLPGVGVRHEFATEAGERVGVVVHRDGRREILVYDRADPDVCTTLLGLSTDDTRTLAELLGASQVTETVTAVQQLEGLSIEWIHVTDDSPAIDRTIREGEYRTRTGASVVAVIRGDTSVPAPDPEFSFLAGDVAVSVGTVEGLATLRALLAP